MKTKVTSKGQITIPYRLRVRYNIRPGDELQFSEGADALILTRKIDEAQMRSVIGTLADKVKVPVAELLEQSRGKVDLP